MIRLFRPLGHLAIAPGAYAEPFTALPQDQRAATAGPVEVIRIHGPLTQYQLPFDGMGFPPDSYESIRMRASYAFASDACAVAVEMSSLGGEVAGMLELSHAL